MNIDEKENLINEIKDNLSKVDNCLKEMKNELVRKNTELIQKEDNSKYLLEVINEKNKELEQKEKNCKYLLEVIDEKDAQLQKIYSTVCWKFNSYVHTAISMILGGARNFFELRKNIGSNRCDIKRNDATENELISVVIPIYDRTDVLIESIESILNQSYKNLELLLVCDGSPEATLEIVKRYEKDKRVRTFYYTDNSGNAVRGRNKAIREARGEYLAFQDSDDIAEVNRLEVSLQWIKKYKVDVVYGGWRALVDGSRDIDIKDGQEIFSPDCDLEMLKEICVPCQSTVMARVEALRAVGGLKTVMRYREDHELWLRLAYAGYTFKSIDAVLTNLRLHKNNLELSFKENDDVWYDKMMDEYKNIVPMKPKIAYVIPGCGISGGIAVICQHVNRLMKRGYDVLLITESDDTEILWFPEQRVEIVTLDDVPDNLDIVVATGWSTAYTIEKIKARRKFYFVQSDETRFHLKGSTEYMRTVDTYKMDYEFITEAKWIQKWLKEEFNKEAYYVPNGLDEKIIYPTAPLIKKGNRLRVLLEGPIDLPYKGMEDAFNAVKDLDCEVWCISSAGKPKPEWKCDRFFEKVPMDQMRTIYSSCDLLLKMSRVEGFFGPPLEMMACGGACVVGKVTGYDEYIVDGVNALVVEQGDVEGAASALKRLLEDRELRERIIANGKETAKQWGWESSIDKLERIYYNKSLSSGQCDRRDI